MDELAVGVDVNGTTVCARQQKLMSWNGYQYEAGQNRVLLGFLAFSQVCAHDGAALAYHRELGAVGWAQRAQVLQVG